MAANYYASECLISQTTYRISTKWAGEEGGVSSEKCQTNLNLICSSPPFYEAFETDFSSTSLFLDLWTTRVYLIQKIRIVGNANRKYKLLTNIPTVLICGQRRWNNITQIVLSRAYSYARLFCADEVGSHYTTTLCNCAKCSPLHTALSIFRLHSSKNLHCTSQTRLNVWIHHALTLTSEMIKRSNNNPPNKKNSTAHNRIKR
jgi:hypothetical protein